MARTIVITGASSGIGRACAERFLGAGWNVALIARRADRLAEVAAGHARALAVAADVAKAVDKILQLQGIASRNVLTA